MRAAASADDAVGRRSGPCAAAEEALAAAQAQPAPEPPATGPAPAALLPAQDAERLVERLGPSARDDGVELRRALGLLRQAKLDPGPSPGGLGREQALQQLCDGLRAQNHRLAREKSDLEVQLSVALRENSALRAPLGQARSRAAELEQLLSLAGAAGPPPAQPVAAKLPSDLRAACREQRAEAGGPPAELSRPSPLQDTAASFGEPDAEATPSASWLAVPAGPARQPLLDAPWVQPFGPPRPATAGAPSGAAGGAAARARRAAGLLVRGRLRPASAHARAGEGAGGGAGQASRDAEQAEDTHGECWEERAACDGHALGTRGACCDAQGAESKGSEAAEDGCGPRGRPQTPEPGRPGGIRPEVHPERGTEELTYEDVRRRSCDALDIQSAVLPDGRTSSLLPSSVSFAIDEGPSPRGGPLMLVWPLADAAAPERRAAAAAAASQPGRSPADCPMAVYFAAEARSEVLAASSVQSCASSVVPEDHAVHAGKRTLPRPSVTESVPFSSSDADQSARADAVLQGVGSTSPAENQIPAASSVHPHAPSSLPESRTAQPEQLAAASIVDGSASSRCSFSMSPSPIAVLPEISRGLGESEVPPPTSSIQSSSPEGAATLAEQPAAPPSMAAAAPSRSSEADRLTMQSSAANVTECAGVSKSLGGPDVCAASSTQSRSPWVAAIPAEMLARTSVSDYELPAATPSSRDRSSLPPSGTAGWPGLGWIRGARGQLHPVVLTRGGRHAEGSAVGGAPSDRSDRVWKQRDHAVHAVFGVQRRPDSKGEQEPGRIRAARGELRPVGIARVCRHPSGTAGWPGLGWIRGARGQLHPVVLTRGGRHAEGSAVGGAPSDRSDRVWKQRDHAVHAVFGVQRRPDSKGEQEPGRIRAARGQLSPVVLARPPRAAGCGAPRARGGPAGRGRGRPPDLDPVDRRLRHAGAQLRPDEPRLALPRGLAGVCVPAGGLGPRLQLARLQRRRPPDDIEYITSSEDSEPETISSGGGEYVETI
ncbi:unnamed protein product [Prorocentrum cordatum]|uniref:Uncharacterized protein n=1 Tax=Prorocentrum cordatum TaxID=2364126 RepID=A0ABN9UE24_9DINO|nr:unnamed protein product [Polarella glacialis]